MTKKIYQNIVITLSLLTAWSIPLVILTIRTYQVYKQASNQIREFDLVNQSGNVGLIYFQSLYNNLLLLLLLLLILFFIYYFLKNVYVECNKYKISINNFSLPKNKRSEILVNEINSIIAYSSKSTTDKNSEGTYDFSSVRRVDIIDFEGRIITINLNIFKGFDKCLNTIILENPKIIIKFSN